MLQRSAFVLGWLGLVPAVIAALVVFLGPPAWRELAFRGGALYAGLILSFLGGAWWGLATRARPERAGALFTVAVAPTLAATALLLLMTPMGLVLMGLVIAATVLVDATLVGEGLTPANWLRLRVPLSLGLGAATIALGVAAMLG
ncbi:MAG: DUF3429 domain-containing protein [Sphingomonadaceae bacterium]|uniref:DUF3429 domain-containing protein n=1 Tax=Thermaurantiacus sp. TaxID=2820283 RepID=UPI00298EF41F|nr:DUF3429 domain-containing protein [Thermaurantiacus sp.]MCS6987129.1 DUF3429 domain-containing protein [Sphingomonadaceae bacterium]MDW8415837.1 DUF3429 domain-containing protein [Thermaurantiacus sp.]